MVAAPAAVPCGRGHDLVRHQREHVAGAAQEGGQGELRQGAHITCVCCQVQSIGGGAVGSQAAAQVPTRICGIARSASPSRWQKPADTMTPADSMLPST